MKNFFKRYLLRKNNIIVDGLSTVSYSIKSNEIGSNWPVQVVNSRLGSLRFGDGCKFFNAFCVGEIECGRFVSILGPGTVLSAVLTKIEIGSFTSIGQNVNIQDSNHRIDKISSYFMSRNIFKGNISKDTFTKGKVVIGEDVWIGSGVTILSGVEIGRGAVIGAGSVVTKNVSPYSIVFGNPARFYKMRFDSDVISFLEKIRWWEWSIEKIIENKRMFDLEINSASLKEFELLAT